MQKKAFLKQNEERRIILSCGSSYAQRVAADECPFLPEYIPREWVKLIWYSDTCGGKLIVFKCGNPYLPKEGKRKGCKTEDAAAAEAERLSQSLSRSRKRIFEAAACNPWEWFFTGTLDACKCDRFDVDATFKRLSQFIRDYRKASGNDVKYLIVPERHKNGAWHFHGLLNGLPVDALHKFSLSERLPLRIRKTIQSGTDVYEWREYSRRFGYTTLTRVRDENAVACYVTKYITKDVIKTAAAAGYRHLYYISKGLQKPATIAESYCSTSYTPICDYENDYVQILKINDKQEAESIIARYGLRREGVD